MFETMMAAMGLVGAAIFLAMRLKVFAHGFDLSGMQLQLNRPLRIFWRRQLTDQLNLRLTA
jgi:hypothetical protein